VPHAAARSTLGVVKGALPLRAGPSSPWLMCTLFTRALTHRLISPGSTSYNLLDLFFLALLLAS